MISKLGIDVTEKLPYEQYECNIFRANYYFLNMDSNHFEKLHACNFGQNIYFLKI